jgi:hypothetical protein
MPTVADVVSIASMLGAIQAGEPVQHGALAVVPLLGPSLAEPDWLTLTEAGALVEVTEVDEASVVVANRANRPLLLIDGEELVGAKENRVLDTTILVDARAAIAIPVSSVERGQRGHRGRRRTSDDASLPASIRRKKAAWVARSVRAGRGHRSDQAGVWAALAARAAEHRMDSPTSALRDLRARFEEEVAAVRRALAPAAGQVGAIVYAGGRWAGADLLAARGLFAHAWSRRSVGYAADAIGAKPASRLTPRPGAVLERLRACPVEPVQAVGLGAGYRLAGLRTTGAALVADDRVAHLTAFPT